MCEHSNSLLCRLLSFFRIIDDHDFKISLTNVALLVTMYKLFQSTDTSINDIGGLFIALSAYNYKKYINKDAIAQAAALVNKITDAADKLTQKES